MSEYVVLCRKVFLDRTKKLEYNFQHDHKNFILYFNIYNRKKNNNLLFRKRNSEKNFRLN